MRKRIGFFTLLTCISTSTSCFRHGPPRVFQDSLAIGFLLNVTPGWPFVYETPDVYTLDIPGEL